MRWLANAGLSLMLTGMLTFVVAMVVFPAASGTQAVTIDRTSMQRVLPLGSVAYIQAAQNYGVGDVVTFQSGANTITHQIVALVPNPATAELDGQWLQTKGSENADPDPPIRRDQILGRVLYQMPYMGVVSKTLSSPVVIAFLVLLAIGLWWISSEPKRAERQRVLKKVQGVIYPAESPPGGAT